MTHLYGITVHKSFRFRFRTKKDIALSYLEKVKQNILRQHDKNQSSNGNILLQQQFTSISRKNASIYSIAVIHAIRLPETKEMHTRLSMMLSLAINAVSKEI